MGLWEGRINPDWAQRGTGRSEPSRGVEEGALSVPLGENNTPPQENRG